MEVTREFTLGYKTKETPKSSESFGPNKFTLGFGSKARKYEVALMWHHFPTRS